MSFRRFAETNGYRFVLTSSGRRGKLRLWLVWSYNELTLIWLTIRQKHNRVVLDWFQDSVQLLGHLESERIIGFKHNPMAGVPEDSV
jgi:hypothetical protein